MSASVDTLTPQNRKPGLPPFRFGDSILLDVQNLIKKIEQTLSEHKQPMKNTSVFNFEVWAKQSGLSTTTVAILRAKELVTREILTDLTPSDILLLGLPLGQKRLLELAVALLKGVPVKIVPRLNIKPFSYDGRSRMFIYFDKFFPPPYLSFSSLLWSVVNSFLVHRYVFLLLYIVIFFFFCSVQVLKSCEYANTE